jgi:hypothetical protein
MDISASERFDSKVKRSSNGCWEWTAGKHKFGYGDFFANGKRIGAHVFSWQRANAQLVPKGICVLHKCDNPSCVRPEHLFLGTKADNNADKTRKGRGGQLFGEKHPTHKFTEKEVRAIRACRTSSVTQIAKFFNTSRRYIFKIRARKRWIHL